MRAPIVALYFARRLQELDQAVEGATAVTHAHPLGIEGASLVASATALSLKRVEPLDILHGVKGRCQHAEFTRRVEVAARWLSEGVVPTPRRVAAELGNGIEATKSCVTAIFVAMSFANRPFEEMLDFVARCGGDTDTIGAMAGAMWGARRGKSELPQAKLNRLEQVSRLSALSRDLYAARLAAG